MKFDDIKKEADTDLPIDGSSIDSESIKIPQLHNKYLKILSDCKLRYKQLESNYFTLYRLKLEYYSGRISEEDLKSNNWEPFQLKVIGKDIEIYINSDKDIQNKKILLELEQQKIEYVESIIKNINNRHWIIKNYIDWKKFVNGIS